MIKRVYAKPTILKVQLNHEQAVLALCSTTTTSLRRSSAILICNASGGGKCRKDSVVNVQDSQSTS
jgi:hypothetical protein